MAKRTGTPVVEILFRDEASPALEKIRGKFAREGMSLFPKLGPELKAAEGILQGVRREVGTLIGITGAGALFGGGFIAGLAAMSRGLAEFGRQALNLHYTAQELGMTSEGLRNLAARAQALGLTKEQAQSTITSLAGHLRDLQTFGKDSAIFKALEEGKGGKELARQLMATINGPGGIDAAIRLFATRMQGMNPEAQRYLRNRLGLSSTALRDIFSFQEGELNKILQPSTPQLRAYNLAWTNLNISWDNIKTTLAISMMPAFERLITSLDKYLQGPGGKLVKQFADWLAGLDVNWDALAQRFVDGIQKLKDIWPTIQDSWQELQKFVEGIGGWGTAFKGVLILGLAGWIGGVATGMLELGKVGWVVGLIAGVAMLAPTSAGAAPAPAPAPGGSGGGGGTSPRRQSYQPSDGDGRPGLTRASYTQAAREDRAYTQDLTRMMRNANTEVAQLASYLSAQGYTTDASGAGGLAGFYGAIRGGGGGFGGGGGTGSGGGGGGFTARARAGRAQGGGLIRADRGAIPQGGGGGRLTRAEVAALAEKHVSASGLVGLVPPDGPRYGITTGSKEEWVHYFTWLAYKESGFNPRSTNLSDPGGSFGLLQVSHLDVGRHKLGGPGGTVQELYDPDIGMGVGVRLTEKLIRESGSIRKGAGRSWAPIRAGQAPPPRDANAPPPPQGPQQQGTPALGREGAILPDPVTGITRGQVGDPRGNYPGRRAGPHQGIDIHAPLGEPIISQAEGTVTRSYLSGSAAGEAIVIKYDNGYEVRYYHLSERHVREGQRVKAGEVVGLVGKTGAGGRQLSSDPHLHYEVFAPNGRRINPNEVLGIGGRTRNVELTSGQTGAATPVDPSIHNVLWSNMPGAFSGPRKRVKIRVNVHGPSGIGVSSDSDESVETTVERVIKRNESELGPRRRAPSPDPSGGIVGHTPA